MNNAAFTVTVCSDPEHEDLVAEIYFGDIFFGVVSQEHGYQSLELEMSGRQASGIPLADVEAAISHAKKRLWELRRTADALEDPGAR